MSKLSAFPTSLSSSVPEYFQLHNFCNVVEILVIMEQKNIIFDSCTGYETIDCAADGYPFFPAKEVYSGSLGKRGFFILEYDELLGVQITLHLLQTPVPFLPPEVPPYR